MDINLLVKITNRAWALPILKLMRDGTAGRQATLLAKTGAGRTAFAQSLKHLVDLGLLERTPGHGHPLRPEYRLTPAGKVAGDMASRIHDLSGDGAHLDLLRRSWTLPILAASAEPRYFSQIKRSLPPITDRALSQSLKHLQSHDWMARDIDTGVHPPRARYHAINTGAALGRATGISV